jgi:hypothetical protein
MTEAVLPLLGWREWLALPQLGLSHIKCKVDTGARTSALHTYFLEPFEEDGVRKVRFGVHPLQGRTDVFKECVADVLDQRAVTDSGGHCEERFVIRTPVIVSGREWPIEITLTNRDNMRFRMLLGRTAIEGLFAVDPAASYLQGNGPGKHKS